MSGFSPAWLALREPFDTAARSAAVVARLRPHLHAGTTAAPLEIVDLGAGAGSNLRYLAPRIGGSQRWRLVDHDRALLEAAVGATQAWAEALGARVERGTAGLEVSTEVFSCEVVTEERDLRALASIDLPRDGLVTAAALLDLVSREWLEAFAHRCRAAHAAVCLALTYDGRTTHAPRDAGDGDILELFNRHQLGDKGFGPALGPAAARTVADVFAARGYESATATSDWRVGALDRAMHHALLEGWLGAACELAPERRATLEGWAERRRAHAGAARAQLVVGHGDFAGWL